MDQLTLFSELQVSEIRKQVMKDLTRIEGEDWDEYLEVVRIETDYRLSLLHPKHPQYKDIKK